REEGKEKLSGLRLVGFDRRVRLRPPFGPGAVVKRHVPRAEDLEGEKQVGGGDARSAGGDDGAGEIDAGGGDDPRELIGAFEGAAVGIEQAAVRNVEAARNAARTQTRARFRRRSGKARRRTGVDHLFVPCLNVLAYPV